MLDEKKKGNDSDDDGDHLPEVGIQAPYDAEEPAAECLWS
jgi:hypothetical protein